MVDRDQEEVGSDLWNTHNQALRDALESYMPVFKEACENDQELEKALFDFKLTAGIFTSDALEDNAKKIVYITAG